MMYDITRKHRKYAYVITVSRMLEFSSGVLQDITRKCDQKISGHAQRLLTKKQPES